MTGVLRRMIMAVACLALAPALSGAVVPPAQRIVAGPDGPGAAAEQAAVSPHTRFMPLLLRSTTPAYPPSFRISVDPAAHARYGLAYPVTYRFALPPNAANLAVYRRYTSHQPWTRLPTLARGQFFNGIEAARFDYPAGVAWVSVAFGGASDDIYLAIINAEGSSAPAQFDGIPAYYDDRSAAVVVTGDDEMDGFHSDFQAAYQAFTAARVVFTSAMVTTWISGAHWTDIQSYVDQGYVEPACHSRTHPLLPYPDYDSEVGGCSQDIKDHLRVPYASGAAEYVVAYVDPGGYSNATLRAKLAEYNYLVERSVHEGVSVYAPWSAGDGLYERVGVTLCGDHRTLFELDSAFWRVTQQNGIYHLYLHPWQHDWSAGSPIRQHIDHIRGRSDIWYVGFGHLYLYRYIQDRGQVTVTPLLRQD